MSEQRVLILGAAGRDFHNFNVLFRDDDRHRVVAFTATQIPGIDGRRYPPQLAGSRYPDGIPIRPESELEAIIKAEKITEAVFSYSDVSHEYVMHLASRVNAAGADFRLAGAHRTMLKAKVPIVAVCAVRTGCGKSQTSRYVAERLKAAGKKVAVVRHPMPYGDLVKQRAQRFGSYQDLETHACTIEEREEYETHIEMGNPMYAGVDYGEILAQAQAEADVVIWDGGNNDTPFFVPDLWITVVDPLRPGHELRYHPGEVNLRGADVVIINKAKVADAAGVEQVAANAAACNPKATIIRAASKLTVADPTAIKGKRVLTVDDGPTLTHGEMPFGAGKVAAEQTGAAAIVNPRPYAMGSIASVFERFPHLGDTLPAMGYSDQQVQELEQTINRAECDAVLFATPIDLSRLLHIDKPAVRVRYDYENLGEPTLDQRLDQFLKDVG